VAVKFTVELKDEKQIKGMVEAVRKGCKENDIDFNGNEKKGHAERAGATIDYVVDGSKVTITVDDSMRSKIAGWNADRIANEVKKWIKPYTK
jgi:uncharacterized protein (UPF0297 family)